MLSNIRENIFIIGYAMKKLFIISFSMIFLCLIVTTESQSHYLLFTPQNNNPGDDPYKFLLFVKDALINYKMDKKRNPSDWETLWPYILKQATGSTSITGDNYKHKGTKLTSEAIIDKRIVPYRYIIANNAKWSIYSENDTGDDNWLLRSDRDSPYRFFNNQSVEKAKIKELSEKLKVIKVKGIALTTGFKRYRILGNWKFYDQSGFDALLPFLSDIEESCYFRMEVAKALKEIPDLYRFRERIKIIDEIITREKRNNPEEDHYRESLVETLKELKVLIDKSK